MTGMYINYPKATRLLSQLENPGHPKGCPRALSLPQAGSAPLPTWSRGTSALLYDGEGRLQAGMLQKGHFLAWH